MAEHDDPFRFSPPPRHVPVSIRFLNLFNAASQIALVWILFSTPFFWLFSARADLSGLTFRGSAATNGTVTDVIETGASENEMDVYSVHYSYSVMGERYSGNSYVTGSPPSSGDVVTVRFNDDKPQRSKIEGMRKSMFGPSALVVVIFPAIGVIGLWFTLKWGQRRNRLLANGLVADGKLEKKEPTGTMINDEPVMALTFGFTAKDGGRHTAVIKTSETKWLTDDDVEQILYDPAAPDQALALDQLDPFPDFDEGGRMMGNLKGAAIRSIVPAATLLANLYFIKGLLS
jgi:hypothetical protein